MTSHRARNAMMSPAEDMLANQFRRPPQVTGTTAIVARWLLAVSVATCSLGLSAGAPRPELHLPDLNDRLVNPFRTAPDTKAIVFVFVSVDCPISNRYAPEIRRLSALFTARGVVFRLVYPNPSESPAIIRRHVAEYRYPGDVVRDPRLELAKFANATVTPEAAVYDDEGRHVYLGRVDDRYVSLGLERPVPTRHDLEDALSAVLDGRPVQQPSAPAVGCFIADFAQ